ncbi:hypothetical protein DMN91_006016 [Ooceraea biroi]|uniref:Uncharacterized protein n=1 Tax=Ooceraea biroi TaxID=2015173 RepID=A0A3L8DMN8_OOCBI|nr:hypothetical protein DMN91_006016 [Ooceraea biroi]
MWPRHHSMYIWFPAASIYGFVAATMWSPLLLASRDEFLVVLKAITGLVYPDPYPFPRQREREMEKKLDGREEERTRVRLFSSPK